MKKRTALTIALLLALPASASAADFADLGSSSTDATIRYLHCSTKLCRLHAATAFIKADTAMLTLMTKRTKRGEIKAGTPCFRASVKWASIRKAPWDVGAKWLQGRATDRQLLASQVAWLQQAVRVGNAC